MARILVGRWASLPENRRQRVWHVVVKCVAILAAILLLLVASGAASSAADLAAAELLQAQLDAGEFAPALELARSTSGGSRAQRDSMLSQIAKAQAASGTRAAALQSTAMIDDDRVLADTLSAIRSQPLSLPGARGGSQADFDSLIELIISTVAAETWDDVGGPGSIMGFEGGVFVDAEGILRRLVKVDRGGTLVALRTAAAARHAGNDDVRRSAPLRKVSLTRLERQVQIRAAQGQPPTAEMQTLAGLQRIKYVLVYPEEGEIVLAGPADDWQTDFEGRPVGKESNRPVLRLDDFVTILRHMMSGRDARFGCSITPTKAALADVQSYLNESGKSPLRPGQRDGWLRQLREKLGQQQIEVYGIDPRTRAGLILVEADYRMKLVGMGLEESVLGVPNYLSMIDVPPGGAPPPTDVLRWWFTLKYDDVIASQDRNAFELRGQGVQLLSENEMLTAAGERIHMGKSDVLNQQFARNFTKHFADLAIKYPIYAELQNLCDLALVAALFRSENLPDKARWHMLHFGDPAAYRVPLAAAPKSVDTVINHRVVNKVHILVGVSGGVRIDPTAYVRPAAIKTDDYGLIKAERANSGPKQDPTRARWWWD